MSFLINKFNEHPIHNTVNEAYVLIQENKEKQLNAEQLEYIDKTEYVINETRKLLDSVEPTLAPIPVLNNVNTSLTHIKSSLSRFYTSNDISNLNNAVAHSDNIIIQLNSLKYIRTPEDLEGLREYMTTFKRSVSQHNRNLEDDYKTIKQEKETLERKLNELNSSVDQSKRRIDSIITNAQETISKFQTQYSEAEDRRSQSFSTGKDERTKETEELHTKFKNDFDKLIENFKREITDIMDFGKTELASTVELYEDSSKLAIEELESLKEEAITLVGVIGNTGMTGAYKEVADKEKKSAIIWQIITGAISVGFLAYSTFVFPNLVELDNFNWASAAYRIFISGIFGSMIAYSAKQANDHTKISNRNRKMELELATIDPYIAVLDDDLKQRLKGELAKKWFGKDDTLINSKHENVDTAYKNAPELLINLLLKEVMKKMDIKN